MGAKTDDRHRALTREVFEELRLAEATNGGSVNRTPKTGPHRIPIDPTPDAQLDRAMTPERIRRIPVTIGTMIAGVVMCASLFLGANWAMGRVREGRALDLAAHDSNAAAHPDLRATLGAGIKEIKRQIASDHNEHKIYRADMRRKFNDLLLEIKTANKSRRRR